MKIDEMKMDLLKIVNILKKMQKKLKKNQKAYIGKSPNISL